MADFFCGDVVDGSLIMVLKGYFDDSGDDKKKRFASVGGLVGYPVQWSLFDKAWDVATYILPEPFHATDCEAQRGCCEGWTVQQTAGLMRILTQIIATTHLGSFGAVVPIVEYRAVFPGSDKYDPYFLALKQTIINMAYVCRLSARSGADDSVTICHEDGETSPQAFQIYHDLKSVPGWSDSKYLVGFSVGDKRLTGLQGADLIAREAFKHADNLGIRNTRKPVLGIKQGASFHLWTRESLEYLKSKGGPTNLEALASWGQRGETVPQMFHWFGDKFLKRVRPEVL
jgi:hypothetical protein